MGFYRLMTNKNMGKLKKILNFLDNKVNLGMLVIWFVILFVVLGVLQTVFMWTFVMPALNRALETGIEAPTIGQVYLQQAEIEGKLMQAKVILGTVKGLELFGWLLVILFIFLIIRGIILKPKKKK